MGVRLVADVMVERLQQWSVPRIFGYSGDGINALTGPCGAPATRSSCGQARGGRRLRGGRTRQVHRRRGRRRLQPGAGRGARALTGIRVETHRVGNGPELESVRAGLDREDPEGEPARRLLDTDASQERRTAP